MSCQIFDRRVQTWKSAARKQKAYMRKSLFMGSMDPEDFLERLNELNEYLGYFPVEGNRTKYAKPLKMDEILDILDGAKRFDWHLTLLAQGRDPESFDTVEDAMQCYRQLYQADQTLHKLQKVSKKSNKSNKKKRKRGTEDAGESSDEKAQGNNKGRANSNGNTHKKNKKYCPHCKKVWHVISECWQKHKNLRPQNVTHSTNNQGKKNFTQ